MRMQLVNFFVGFAALLWATLAYDVVWPLINGEFAEAMENICAMQEAQRTEEVPIQGMPEAPDCDALKSDAYQRAYLHSGLVIFGILAWGWAFASGEKKKKKWILLFLSSLTYGTIWGIKVLSIANFTQFLALSLSGDGIRLAAAAWREVVTPLYFTVLMVASAALAYSALGKSGVDR